MEVHQSFMKDQNYISDDAAEDIVETRANKHGKRKRKQLSASDEKSNIQNLVNEQTYISDDASTEDSTVLKEIQPKQRTRKTAKKLTDQKIAVTTLAAQQMYISDDTTEQSAEDSLVKETQPKRRTRKRGKKVSQANDANNQLTEESIVQFQTKPYISDDTTENSAEDTMITNEKENGKKRKRGKKVSQSNDANNQLAEESVVQAPIKPHISDDTTENSAENIMVLDEKEKGKKRKRGKKVSQSNDANNQLAEESVVQAQIKPQISDDTTENLAEDAMILDEKEKGKKRKRGKKTQSDKKSISNEAEENTALTNTKAHISDEKTEHSAEVNKIQPTQEKQKCGKNILQLNENSTVPNETNPQISEDVTQNLVEENIVVKETDNKIKRKRGKKISLSPEKQVTSPSLLKMPNVMNNQLIEEAIIPDETQIKSDEKMRGKKRGNKVSLSDNQGTPKKKQRTESVLNSTFSIESEEECVKIYVPNKIRKNSSGSWIESETISRVVVEQPIATESKSTELELKPVEVIEQIETKKDEVKEPSIKNQVRFKAGPKSLNLTLNETKNVTLRTPVPARKSISNINLNSVKKKVNTPATASKKVALPSRDQNLTSNIPKLAKAKAAPNFSEIHKKNFLKMQSVDEYVEKKLMARTASAVKNRDKSVVDGVATPRDHIKSRLFPTPSSEKPIKINFVSGKLFFFPTN